jgi:hypothetical protein
MSIEAAILVATLLSLIKRGIIPAENQNGGGRVDQGQEIPSCPLML